MPVSPSSKSSTVANAEAGVSPNKGKTAKDPGFNALLEVVAQVTVVSNSVTSQQTASQRSNKQSDPTSLKIKSKLGGQVDVASAGLQVMKSAGATISSPLPALAQVNAGTDTPTTFLVSSSKTTSDIVVKKKVTTPIDGQPTVAIDQSAPSNSATNSKVLASSPELTSLNSSETSQINLSVQSLQKGNMGQDPLPSITSQQNGASVSLEPLPTTNTTFKPQPFQEPRSVVSAVIAESTSNGKGGSNLSVETAKTQVTTALAKSSSNTGPAFNQVQEVAAILPNAPGAFSTITATTSSNSNISVGGASYVSVDQIANVVAAHISSNPSLPSTIHLRIFPKDLGVLNIHLSGVEGSLTVKMEGTSAELGSQLNSAMGQLAKELQAALAVKVSLNLGSFGTNGGKTEKEFFNGSLSSPTPVSGLTHPQRPSSLSALGRGQHVIDIWA